MTLNNASAVASKKTLFECPDLYDSDKRSIEPLTQGYDGWFFRENDLKMDFSISPQSLAYLKRIQENLKNQNIEFIFVSLLTRALMASDMVNKDDPWQESYNVNLAKKSYQEFIRELEEVNITTVNLDAVFSKIENSKIDEFNFKRDIHWKPMGADLVAQKVAEKLKKINSYDSLTKVNTVLEKHTQIARSGTITEELQKLCTTKIEAEIFDIYKSKTIIEKNENALFGSDTETTPVALLGTSFSAQDNFSFPAYLQSYSGLDIANFAIPGGGMFTSILSYLSSPYFHENKPPAIIWEIQSVYSLNKGTETLFRQVIPSIHGECEGENLVIEKDAQDISNSENHILFDNLADKKIFGEGYYLHLNVDNPSFNNFVIEFEYDDGDGEWFPIDRTDRFNNKGQYYIELSNKIDTNLNQIILKNSQNIPTEITAKLCQAPNINKKVKTIKETKT